MSKHSEDRQLERSIGDLILELIARYGDARPAPGGVTIQMLSKRKRKQLIKQLKMAEKNLSSAEPVYLVKSRGGEVLTVSRRTRRVRR